jgi:hypothetical protein
MFFPGDEQAIPARLLFSLSFGVSFLNVTESDKCVEDGNARVHDDRVILAVLSSELEDPLEGVVEHLVARGNAVIR